MSKKSLKSHVLSDHKKIGKRFVPPFIAAIGNLSEVSWVDQIIPQLIWIARLIDTFGFKKGVDHSLAIARIAKESADKEKTDWFGWLSSFSNLSEQQKSFIIEKLTAEGILDEISSAFSSFVTFYPAFPLLFLTTITPKDLGNDTVAELEEIKQTLLNLYDRRSVFAMRVQATVIYLAFVNDFLKVAKGLALADFPEIENYPNTERSKEVAASIRATINSFAGLVEDAGFNSWSNYFWNRGLEIEPCLSNVDRD
jgi:hypothetical protein